MRLLLTLGLVISLSVTAQDVRETDTSLRGAANSLLVQALESRVLALQAPVGDPLSIKPVSPVAQAVGSFYEQRGYQPVWTDPVRLQALIEALEGLVADGLENAAQQHRDIAERYGTAGLCRGNRAVNQIGVGAAVIEQELNLARHHHFSP